MNKVLFTINFLFGVSMVIIVICRAIYLRESPYSALLIISVVNLIVQLIIKWIERDMPEEKKVKPLFQVIKGWFGK